MSIGDESRTASQGPRGGPSDAVKSAARVLEIFELFCECRVPLTVGDVAARLGYPQSSTSVLIRSLQKLGYLSFDSDTRTFSPTVRLAVLGGWVNDLLLIPGTVTRLMQDIREQTGLTVMLGLQNGYYVQYAHVEVGLSKPTHYLRIGQMRPIGLAALGKILLSLKSDAEVALLLRTMNASMEDSAQRIDVSSLQAELVDVRRYGYARSRGSVVPGRDVVAVQFATPPGVPPLALGVSGDIDQMDLELDSVLAILRKAATTLAPEPDPVPVVESASAHTAPGRASRWHPE